MLLSLMNEHGQHVSLWQDYLQTQFDPAHLLSELGFTVVFDLFIGVFLWGKVIKPLIVRDVHKEIDAEHGVEHESESV